MNSPYDLVGPVLPQALRLARYQAIARLPQNVNDLQGENDTINQTPTREEERLLASNANVMAALENLFSWRQKDRRCRTSKLSRMESVRFQRTIYRIWLMSVLFGPRRFTPRFVFSEGDYESFERDYKDRKSDLKKSWEDQITFLQQFSTQELFQIQALSFFLSMTAEWAVTAEGTGLSGTRLTYDWDGLFLFAGPHIILRCYEDATTNHLPMGYLDDQGPYTKFLTHALSEVVKKRGLTGPIKYVGIILDDLHGVHERCRHCIRAGNLDGFESSELSMLPNLHNETNWDDLKGQLDRQLFVGRNLCYNLVEKPLLRALDGDWSALLHEMFACRSGDYAQWSKEDWICLACWTYFFCDTIWRWGLSRKENAGESIEEDCRYGYSCEKQCFEGGLAHARQFNHLCKPIEETPTQGF